MEGRDQIPRAWQQGGGRNASAHRPRPRGLPISFPGKSMKDYHRLKGPKVLKEGF